jgi:WD40 repeat protein
MRTSIALCFFSWLLVMGTSAGQGPASPARTDLYGDPLPAGAVARMGTLRLRNPRAISRLVVAPDGRTLASWHGGQGGTLCLWEAGTGRELRRVAVPNGRLYDLRLQPGGRSVAVVGNGEGQVFLWDFAAGQGPPALGKDDKLVQAGGGDNLDHERFGFFTVSPDGKLLAGGSFGFTNRKRFVRLWDVATGKELAKLKIHRDLERNQGVLQWLAFTPDGRALVSASPAADGAEDVLTFWDVQSGKELRRLRTPLAYRHDVGAAVAFSGDGRFMALGLQDTTVRLWDVAAARELRTLRGHERRSGLGTIFCVAFAPDGKTLASAGSDRTVRLWDPLTGAQRLRWEDRGGQVEALAFFPGGGNLAAGGHDGTIHLWDVTSDKVAGPPGRHQGGVASLVLAPDGKTLATSDGEGVRLWDAATGREQRHTAVANAWTTVLHYGKAGQQLLCVTSRKGLRLWDALGDKDSRLPADKRHGPLRVLSATPDATFLATVAADGAVSLWNARTGKERAITVAPSAGFPTALAPASRWFAAAGLNPPGIHLWEVGPSLKHRFLPPHRDMIFALAFSPDGNWLASGGRVANEAGFQGPGGSVEEVQGTAGCALLLWQVVPGRLARRFAVAPPGTPDERSIDVVAFSPDGRTLATGEGDGTLGLYETATGRLRRRLTRHQDIVLSLAFSADGKLLASGSQDRTALVWDLIHGDDLVAVDRLQAGLNDAWTDLADLDAAKGYRAVRSLALCPKEALPFLKAHLRPAATLLPPGRLAQLLKDLDAERYVVRARAAAELEALGELVETPVRKALEGNPSLEKKRRLERLVLKLDRPWERLPSAQQLRELRAIEALELVGTREAQDILQGLTAGAPEAVLTQQARASLERLQARATGP